MSRLRSNLTIYKGHIVYTPKFAEIEIVENGYVAVVGSRVKGVYKVIPGEYNQLVVDYGDRLIIPGFVDLHFHAPQMPNIGLGLDKQLIPWLKAYTFPEEAKYRDLNYAQRVYKEVARQLIRHGTTRVSLFATIHTEATKHLVKAISEAGLGAFVGKVNMDRNSPEDLVETTEESLRTTEEFLSEYLNKYKRVKPIVTPRFVPTCTPRIMSELGNLAKKYNCVVQSHISENMEEVKWVRELHPEFRNYASIYNYFGLLGHQPTIMAHSVFLNNEELDLMAQNRVYIAHCPIANFDLSSGIAPVRKFIEKGINVGLGTDVSGGHEILMTRVMWQAIQASKMMWLMSGKRYEPFTIPEVFYMGTKGGGSFFGKVGSFEQGYEFDALVIDDRNLPNLKPLTIGERLERFIYTGDDRNIVDRFVAGEKIYTT
jgi:guanine deaminase